MSFVCVVTFSISTPEQVNTCCVFTQGNLDTSQTSCTSTASSCSTFSLMHICRIAPNANRRQTYKITGTFIWTVQSQLYIVVQKWCIIGNFISSPCCLSATSILSSHLSRKMAYALDMEWPWSLFSFGPRNSNTERTRTRARVRVLFGLGEGERARDWMMVDNCYVIIG